MPIWVLVCLLLIISIALFALSVYAKDDNVQAQIDAISAQQSQEFYTMKTRLAELEKAAREEKVVKPVSEGNHYVEPVVDEEEVDLSTISEMTRDEVIRLYSQGYTMNEISHHVALSNEIIQTIVDDYIENR